MKKHIKCPRCGEMISCWQNPTPTVDILIHCRTPNGNEGLVLILRKNEPQKWAIPGGFVDYGESVEEAAAREAGEETSLKIRLIRQFHCYSDPDRDLRQHNQSIVILAEAEGIPQAADDAAEIGLFTRQTLPDDLAFDHRQILEDYFSDKY